MRRFHCANLPLYVAIMLMCAGVGGFVWAGQETGATVSDASLSVIRGKDQTSSTYTAAGLCEAGSLGSNQVSQYDCDGNLGVACVKCVPGTYADLHPGTEKFRMETRDCDDAKQVGTCYRGPDTNWNYICANPVFTGTNCTATIPDPQPQPIEP